MTDTAAGAPLPLARTGSGETAVSSVAFAGTPVFASVALQAIRAAGFDVPLVLTQPDRPAGRGLKLQASAVKQFALQHGLPLLQPRGLRLDGRFGDDAAAAAAVLQSSSIDVLVVAAYGLILPQWVLDVPRRGCLNIHASLLPRWRGAAPIQRAIEAGDAETGITVMQMDAGLDTGAMLLREPLAIAAADTAASLHDRLAALGAGLVVAALRTLHRSTPIPQPAAGITWAPKIDKAEAAIDWTLPAAVLERRIRAFDPFPGCSCAVGGETVKVWRAAPTAGRGVPGTVLAAASGSLVVACGDGALSLLLLQRPGGRRIAADDFLRAQPVAAGTVLRPSPVV